MASLRVSLSMVALLVFILNIDHSSSQSSIILPENHRALFIFGDSLFDPGNNNYINATTFFQSNFPPYGETFFNYPTGRFSDGRVIPDFIAEHAKLPLIPPYLHPAYHDHYIYGVNFASAGAGALFETNQGLEIYNEGGRKFGFANVFPLNCLPLLRRSVNGTTVEACIKEEASALARLHNIALSNTLQKLQKHLNGFTFSISDFYGTFVELIKYPSKYGFKEGNEACCGGGPYRGDYSCGGKRGIEEYELCDDVNHFVFFDSLHPTERAAEHYANLMWNGNTHLFQTHNLKHFFHDSN